MILYSLSIYTSIKLLIESAVDKTVFTIFYYLVYYVMILNIQSQFILINDQIYVSVYKCPSKLLKSIVKLLILYEVIN